MIKMGLQVIKNIYNKILHGIIFYFFRKFFRKNEYEIISYSQEGEDIILKRMLDGKEKGFFVDIGAHHPRRFSNTFLFYKKGFRGINIDPIPDIKKLFDKERPNDITIEIAISDTKSTQKYYNFKEQALNTFSESIAKNLILDNWELENILDVKTTTLNDIFEDYLPSNVEIDFLDVDVEGFEINVLRSNNWNKYKPKIILIEIRNKTFEEVLKSDVYVFLTKQGYSLFAKTFNTVFFKYELSKNSNGG